MRKQEIFWIGVLLLLVWAYIHFFTQIGVTRTISVSPSLRRPMGRRAGSTAVYPVFFTLNGDYRLTSIKVTSKETNPTEPHGHVLWHLVAKGGADPVKFFQYGQNIKDMTPDPQGSRVEPLETNVTYHLELEAGKVKGGTDFKTSAVPE